MSQTPLQFARDITAKVNDAWLSGEYLENVTPTTKQLLTYWFDERYIENRDLNFHEGQKQAVLNIVYLHEILRKEVLMRSQQRLKSWIIYEKP